MEYPKSLYQKGWLDLSLHIVVNSPEQEEEARKHGYRGLSESVARVEEPKAEPVKKTRAKKAE